MPDLSDTRPHGEGPHRSAVVTEFAAISVMVRVRLQWEYDHWIAEWRGRTATGATKMKAIDALRPAIRFGLESRNDA